MATLFGDTSGSLSGTQKGKHQDLVGTDNESNFLVGDAGESITDHARGGNDTLTGGNNSGDGGNNGGPGAVVNTLYGDANTMQGFAGGGNEMLDRGIRGGGGVVEHN